MDEPKTPRVPPVVAEPLQSSSSGEHRLGILESPVTKSDRPSLAEPTIDQDKLLKAWEALIAVNTELIRVVEKNEADNAVNRSDNAKTRRLVSIATMIAAAIVLWAQARILQRVEHASDLVDKSSKISQQTSTDVGETLKAVRAMAKALGAKVEADAMLTPHAEEKAQAAAVEAQVAAVEAEKKVTTDPVTKAKATEELKELKAPKPKPPIRVYPLPADAMPPPSAAPPGSAP